MKILRDRTQSFGKELQASIGRLHPALELPDRGKAAERVLQDEGVTVEAEVVKGEYSTLKPVREVPWEDYHSGANPGQSVAVPARELAESLGLWIKLATWDLYDREGQRASIATEWEPSWRSKQRFTYLRQDLLDKFLAERGLALAWAAWGERSVRFESHLPYPPPGVDFVAYRRFQEVLVYRGGRAVRAAQVADDVAAFRLI